ncbi:MAG TPA: hypothetical protein VKF63_05785 [Terracidiphilus sp.]|nr:hypothetical protein [Terracidiphilus sp.]
MAELRGANPIESGPAELICKIRRFAREAFLREFFSEGIDFMRLKIICKKSVQKINI